MTIDDWYRNKSWDEEVEREFFSRLKRARSQRDQYIVIQASTLVRNHPEIALLLVDYYFESRKDDFFDMSALLARAQAFIELGKTVEAMGAFRSVLVREDEFPNHLSNTYVEYPYIVATRGIESEYENVLQILNQHIDRLTFPLDHFMWHAAIALIENDAKHASMALEAAEITKSGFRYHQNVGLVGKEHEDTIKQLCEIST